MAKFESEYATAGTLRVLVERRFLIVKWMKSSRSRVTNDLITAGSFAGFRTKYCTLRGSASDTGGAQLRHAVLRKAGVVPILGGGTLRLIYRRADILSAMRRQKPSARAHCCRTLSWKDSRRESEGLRGCCAARRSSSRNPSR